MSERERLEDENVNRTGELLGVLKALSNPDVQVNQGELAQALISVYSSDSDYRFRHQYSEITRFLYNQEANPEICSLICEELNDLEGLIEDSDVCRSIDKLIDHISLESLRIGQMQQTIKQTESLQQAVDEARRLQIEADEVRRQAQEQIRQIAVEREELHQKQLQLKNNVEAENKKINNLINEVKAHNIESIAVLSVFAGVVFAFTGGFSILGSVFASIPQISKDNSTMFLACVIIIALVLFDVIHMLMHFTNKLVKYNTDLRYRPMWVVNAVGAAISLTLLADYYDVFARTAVWLTGLGETGEIEFCGIAANTTVFAILICLCIWMFYIQRKSE